MDLNVGLDISFDNMREWRNMAEESREVSTTETYITYYEISRWIFNGRYTNLL
jgi:hypothetical protein